jgi:hypothetical protein
MTDNPVHLTRTGPPETILAPEPEDVTADLAAALARPEPERRAAVAAVVARAPRSLDGWAALGRVGRDPVESYACFRVGYHRGLDRLRAEGWRGSGYVRWSHETNRGFLSCLAGLARLAHMLGEADEAERCETFLCQLDPTWPPEDL